MVYWSLLDQLEVEGVVVSYGNANESAYKVVKNLKNLKNLITSDDKGKRTASFTLDSSYLCQKTRVTQ